MRLASFNIPIEVMDEFPGIVLDEYIVDAHLAYHSFSTNKSLGIPDNLVEIIEYGFATQSLNYLYEWLKLHTIETLQSKSLVTPLKEVRLLSPLSNPKSLRDFYAFEGHIATASANRGREVPKEWYQFPVFYFSNTSSIYGLDDTIPYPSYSDSLDYELEVACVIGKAGRDIPADKAEEHIFGYMIFNDWSARDVQQKEMRVGLGPAKGKDFANSFGPYLVTPDELADRHTGRPGVYDLEMVARVNGVEKSRGNWKDLYWSFGQMIERASQDVTLQPGDVIGSGTVGTGCLLELTKGDGPWLQPGDVVELEVERLGILRNTIGEKPTKPDGVEH